MTEQPLHIPELIVGATFAAIGLSIAVKHQTLVVEPAAQLGPDFIGCFRPGEQPGYTARTEAGRRLQSELVRRSIMDENGGIHTPAVLPVLSKLVLDERLPLMLMTRIVGITEHAEGFEVTLSHVSGIQTVIASAVIDTTSRGLPWGGQTLPILHKSINAAIHHPDPDAVIPEPFDARFTTAVGKFRSERFIQLALAPDDDWMTARYKLHELWSGRPAHWQQWSIATVADSFDIRPAKGPAFVRDRWLRLPSSAYAHILEALDEGILYREGAGGPNEADAVDRQAV